MSMPITTRSPASPASVSGRFPVEPEPLPDPRPTMELVLVTPELAEAWLAKSKNYRHLRQSKRERYGTTMKSGEWLLTGESIKFDTKGRLFDGQHRLYGVVDSGVSVWMFVVRNLHPDVAIVVDTGMKRTAGDALRYAGYESSNALAALARIAILWDEGFYRYAIQARPAREVTSMEIVEWVEENDDALLAVSAGESLRKQSPIPGSAASFAALVFQRIDPDEATAFFGDIAQMRTSGEGDPVFTLLRRYRAAQERRETLTTSAHLFLLFRTWNARRRGEELRQLKMGKISVHGGGTVRIEIPVPLGTASMATEDGARP